MNNTYRAYLYCIITIFLFSTLELCGKLIGAGVSPNSVTVYRFFYGGVFLYIIYKLKERSISKLSFSDYSKIILCGILNVCVSMMFLQLSIFYGKATIAAVLISANPLFVVFFAWLILKEKMNFKKTIALILGISGIIMLVFGSGVFENSQHSKNIALGVIFGILSSMTFALYTVLSKKYIIKYGNLRFNSLSFFWASIFLALSYSSIGNYPVYEFTLKNTLLLLYLGIFVSGLAYFLYGEALKTISAFEGASFFMLKPVFAAVMNYTVIGETLNTIQISGIAVILIGMMQFSRRGKTGA